MTQQNVKSFADNVESPDIELFRGLREDLLSLETRPEQQGVINDKAYNDKLSGSDRGYDL